VEPELAFGLPAAGALGATLLRDRRRLAYSVGGALGIAGVAAALIGAPGEASQQLGIPLLLGPGARAILAASALALAFVIAVAPAEVDRLSVLVAGLVGLAAVAALAAGSQTVELALLLLLLAAGQATLPGLRPFPARLRGPAFGAALLSGGALLASYSGRPQLSRLAAVLLVLGLAASVGLLPFLQELVPEEPVPASPIAWTGFVGPALAVGLSGLAPSLLNSSSAPVYGALLIGLGLVNIGWGGLAAWRAADDVAAWRYSFLADWGLALVGLGLLVPSGVGAARLMLVFLVAIRLPLYALARPLLLGRDAPGLGPAGLLVAASLAGAAPFAGFPARLLLLKASSDVYWPLALVLVPALLLWLPASLRLGRSVGRARGRRALGIAVVSAVSLAIGIYPAPLLAVFGGST
jgi:hypothetical protein